MIKVVLILVLLFSFGCNQKEETLSNPEKENNSNDFEFSEMSTLMEKIYTENTNLKKRISKGDSLGQFPKYFLKIYEAKLTDTTNRDTFFTLQAKTFIEAQRLIYENPSAAKEQFNNTINMCIQCHQVKCLGPIPRIKKLYIN